MSVNKCVEVHANGFGHAMNIEYREHARDPDEVPSYINIVRRQAVREVSAGQSFYVRVRGH